MNYKTRQPFPHAAYVEGQRNFTYFDRSLTSGLTDVVIESPGDFLYIDQALTGVVSVELNMRQGGTLAPILLAAGGSIECDFASFKLNATAQLNKSARVIVGNGARIKGGANVNPSSMLVSVVDGAQIRVESNQAMFGSCGSSAVAANYSHGMLYNPVGSGKNVFLETSDFMSDVTGLYSFGLLDNAANPTYLPLYTVTQNPISKKIGSAYGGARLYGLTAAAQYYSTRISTFRLTANAMYQRNWPEPILLQPGYGFVVFSDVANCNLSVSHQWFEQ